MAAKAMTSVALVQCPAWGALPPLGPAALKAYVLGHGHDAHCFDLNIDFYNRFQRAAPTADSDRVYGGPDPWGPESYDEWAWTLDERNDFRLGSADIDRLLPIEEWAGAILECSPDVVGFTVYMTSAACSLQLAAAIKRRAPEVLIVFGGPSAARDQDGEKLLFTSVPDVVVDGEGETALVDLLDCCEQGGDLRTVAGLGLVVDMAPVWTDTRPLIPKVDSLPYPDFSDYDWSDYPNPYLIPIMASRGCVLDCAFCYETVYWKRFRTQSAARIVDEIEHQVALHPLREQAEMEDRRLYFMFADSLVNGHLGGLSRMCDLLIERQTKVWWGGQATINTKMDDDFCRRLAESGCTGLAFGLESGSQDVLDAMGKKFQIADAAEFMRRMHEAGVTVTVNVMVGFPTERFGDFVDTLRFLLSTRRWIYQVSNVATTGLAPGSELYLFPERFGVTMSPEGSWESPDTGNEKNRQRRLELLHLWMKLIRVPHQNIAAY